MTETILAISGYRDFYDHEVFETELNKFFKSNGRPTKMIFGECRGTDKLALQYAKDNNIPYAVYAADWAKHGTSAGPKRNEKLINDATHLVAFLSPMSKGTVDAINKAVIKKIPVIQIDI